MIGPALPPHGVRPALGAHEDGVSVAQALPGTWSQPVARGLVNLGNSCYLNSTVQCLAHLPPLSRLCLQRAHSRGGCSLRDRGLHCTPCVVENQIARMLTSGGGGGADVPRALHNCLRLRFKTLEPGRQEDAHEFLRCLVGAMEGDLLRCEGRNPNAKDPNTVVNQLFQGVLESSVRCLRCGNVSRSFEACMDLSLELGRADSVEGALGLFTKEEALEGRNQYSCDHCERKTDARKRLALSEDPNVLVLHLKRFEGLNKITRDIAFPPTLNMRCFMSGGGGDGRGGGGSPVYDLHGVLVHEGSSPRSGHYTALVRDGCARWHHVSDSYVSPPLPAARALDARAGAYLLFYVRRSMRALARVPQAVSMPPPPPAAKGMGAVGAAAAAAAAGKRPGADGGGAGEAKRRRSEGLMSRMTIGPQLPPGGLPRAAAAPPTAGASASASAMAPAATAARAWELFAAPAPAPPNTTRIAGPRRSFGTPAAAAAAAAAAAPPSVPAGAAANAPPQKQGALPEPAAAAHAAAASHAGGATDPVAFVGVCAQSAGASGGGDAANAAAARATHAAAAAPKVRPSQQPPQQQQQQRQQRQPQQQQQSQQPPQASEAVCTPPPSEHQVVVGRVMDKARRTQWVKDLHARIARAAVEGATLEQVLGNAALLRDFRRHIPPDMRDEAYQAWRAAAEATAAAAGAQ